MNRPVIEMDSYGGSKEISIESRLLKESKVFLYDDITRETTNYLVQQLMYLESHLKWKEILYILQVLSLRKFNKSNYSCNYS